VPPATPSLSLLDLGWDDSWAAALAAQSDGSLTPGRVSRIDRGISTVLIAGGPVRVAAVADLQLAVGDWVTLTLDPTTGALDPTTGALDPTTGDWVLAGILPRRCAFRRVTDGPAARQQVVAANIDTVFLVDAIDGQLSVRHLERYVVLALQSGAQPVIVVTKSDLASPEQVSEHLAQVAQAASGAPVHVVSAATDQGVDALAPYLGPGRTVALLGLSGAGKSTLVNLLVGAQVLATGAVRSDGKGRHTTTYRELVAIPGGGLLIDTPGMRALSVATATEGVALVFADIEELETRCRFPDCSHTTEAGCAVMEAVATGDLSAERLASWRQLRSETPPEDPAAARVRVAVRKRDKASAKATRAQSRATQRKLALPPPT